MNKAKYLILFCLLIIFPCACAAQGNHVSEKEIEKQVQEQVKDQNIQWNEIIFDQKMPTDYSTQFEVQFNEDGYALITIAGKEKYLLVPENRTVPKQVDETITILQQPLNTTYLVSSSVMDFICTLDKTDFIRFSGTNLDGWYLEKAKKAMEEKKMIYAGKYSAPDYELLISQNCNFAIENTMIYHNPEVKEQLERLQIPVFVEYSSYEKHPLGRLEWIKLYGLLFGEEEKADIFYSQQIENVKEILNQKNTGKTVAFFYVTSNGAVNVRKSDDYVAEMIRLSGGEYLPKISEDGNALSTQNMQMEAFYAEVKDADYLIYNGTIDNQLNDINDLLSKNPLFNDFKAVKNQQVWCAGKNMFQETTSVTDFILDLHKILTCQDESTENYKFLYHLQEK